MQQSDQSVSNFELLRHSTSNANIAGSKKAGGLESFARSFNESISEAANESGSRSEFGESFDDFQEARNCK